MILSKQKMIPLILTLYIAFVFLQSLFFKFTYSPETAYIFGVLDGWAAGFGLPGLFVPPGIFNAYVIGSAELVASALLLGGLFLANPVLSILGSALAMAVISGAIFFHLFTPLGVEVLGDGGLLFTMACGVWVAAGVMLVLHRPVIEKLWQTYVG
jgi:uncharacterized membrane protein YphA (DoxX/SURF4 family)